jgi:glucosamine-6-phosphate isomerase
MCRAAANFTAEYVRNNPAALLCFPSGDTPREIFKYLVDDARNGDPNFQRCIFLGLDEWVGLNEDNEGSCRHYMDHHLFFPLNIQPEKIHFFNGAASDLDEECRRIDEFIREKGSIDLMMVGLGLNGHVGLNEPGVDFELYSHISDLDEKTKYIAKKYFSKEVLLTYGITLGPRHLLESKVAVIIASGSKKAEIVAQALEHQVSNEIPASIIQKHPDAYVFIDQDAAGLLSK